MSRVLSYGVSGGELPVTLEKFLRRRGYSHDLLTRLRLDDLARVNGSFHRMIDPLSAGDTVRVTLPDEEVGLPPNPRLSLAVLYEDEDILAVDKPGNMLVHPAGKGFDDAIGNFFAVRCPGLCFRPIGRLDRHTTGVCLIAKHQLAASLLSGRVDKDYYAVAEGEFAADSGEIDAPLLRLPGPVIRRRVDAAGQPSLTRYRVLRRLPGLTFLQVELVTGRTHQIRAHMSYIGHPLAGDSLYGGHTGLIPRQALHCGCLRFTHPVTGQAVEIISPLPADIQRLLEV